MYRALLLTLIASVPSSANYTLKAYDFGNGGGTSTSSSYQLKSSVASPGGNLTSASYALPPGVRASTTISAPQAPAFTNPANNYDRLKIVLNTTGMPTDATYAIAISSNGFATTQYVQPDQTIGNSLSAANYQTYAAWGGAGGSSILSLASGTAYQVKVAAMQGAASAGPYGPTASASTVSPSATFTLATSLTGTPPFATNFTSLTPGSVNSGDATIIATTTTNAANGGSILLKDVSAGLHSTSRSYTLASATADLSVASAGYGGQLSGTSQTSGGPMIAVSPYNGTGNAVGALSAALQPLASFSSPVTTGSLTLALKAKTDYTAPAATDYSDTITVSLSLLF